ncbi:MAG: molybdopterin dinucleotide binding domain-containing protein [Aggregatilineaceae bacterium]
MTNFTRRDFLKIGAAGTATAILTGCGQETERWVTLEPYVRAPEEQLAGVPNWYASTCRLCPAGCGIIVRIMNGRAVKIEGNPEHPVNRGKLCARGQAGLQLLYNPDRVTGAARQEERGSRKFKPLAWNEAINTLYEKLNAAGGAVGIWLGSSTSGHLHDLFARFAAAVGAPPPLRYDLYAGLNGYSALLAANEALFGRAALPTYELSRADLIFSFGADFLGTWLSATAYGVEFGKFRDQPYGKRGLLVQFEPKMSITGAKADRWVPVRPGAEALVAQALVRLIADEGYGGPERSERAVALAGDVDLDAAAAACDLAREELTALARLFAEAGHPVAIPGPALAGAGNSVAAAMAVQALNVVTGAIGLPGGVQLAPQVPARLVPFTPSPYADVQALLERMKAGQVKVLLVHGANPVYDLPPQAGVAEALEKVETIVSFNPLVDETAALADYLLPDRVYLEGWGYEVVQPAFQGVPVVSSQQPVVGPFHDVRPTGDVLLTVARGIPAAASALPWTDEVAFIKETITALPKGAQGGEDAEVRWARFLQHGGWWPEVAPESAVPQVTAQGPVEVTPVTFDGDEAEYPFYLHLYLSVLLGDGRGANLPWLQGAPDPLTTVAWQTWVEINPATAQALGVQDGDIVRVESPYDAIEAIVYVFPAIRPDTIAIPLGQGHSDSGRYARGRGAHALRLVGAAADETGTSFTWANVRVKVTKLDRKQTLARLESTIDPGPDVHIPF